MDFLRQSIDIIWNRIPVEDFIRKYLYSRESEEAILSEQYARLLVDQYRELTLEEAEGVERQLRENWLKRYSRNENTSSFFFILIHFSHDMLRIQEDEPVCRFEHLLRWWETTQLVGPDLPATAYLAYEDVMHNNERKTFAWPSVIRHDYALLNAIMQKGLTELHSHLNGASLNFDLQWLSLMNNVQHREKDCKRLEWYKFASAVEHPEYNPYSLYALIVMAAEMRRWLFEQHVLKHQTNLQLNKEDSLPDVGKIDASIQTLRATHGYLYIKEQHTKGRVVDYAIDDVLPDRVAQTEMFVNSLVQGERRILYHALRYIYGGSHADLYSETQRILMAYTRIKCHVRQQLVQANLRKGFKNFQQYQDDKELFIQENSIYEELLKDMALKNAYCNNPTRYLEYRITPKNSGYAIRMAFRKLKQYDYCSYIANDAIKRRSDRCSKYAIVHFIKKHFEDCEWATVRNYRLRKNIYGQSLALRSAYQKSRYVREMLCAIDAANAEREARPEVFAHAFRFLRSELNGYRPDNVEAWRQHVIHVTYHVGEDFWDVVDGLRAIDEAMLFLEMESDDRIGHGLALGTMPEEYYRKRHYSIIMPRQVLMDNIVWLHYKAQSLGITLPPQANSYIEETVSDLSQKIYGVDYPMDVLYKAWQLRGDDPDAICEGVCKDVIAGWDKYARSERTKQKYSGMEIPKDVKECVLRYHLCRKEGDKMITKKFEQTLIPIIREVQDQMMAEIGKRHIAVETNPTSNVRIGDFYRYDQHPIFRFKEHLSISINTDDVGVFDTSQSNEYALIACAMEKMRDGDGKLKYPNSNDICNWLDEIRETSISQRFVKDDLIIKNNETYCGTDSRKIFN